MKVLLLAQIALIQNFKTKIIILCKKDLSMTNKII